MSALGRLSRVMSGYGIKGVLFKLYAAAVDRWFDLRYGTDTCRWATLDQLHVVGTNRRHGHRYEPARIVELRRLFRRIRPLVPDDSALVDLGSGKGRMLLVAAECGFAAATGVEFAAELCEIARNNCLIFQRKTGSGAQFRIVEGDVVDYQIGERDRVFVFFNPFDDAVMEKVIARICASLVQHPRRVFLCLYNTNANELIDRASEFSLFEDTDHFGYRMTMFCNVI